MKTLYSPTRLSSRFRKIAPMTLELLIVGALVLLFLQLTGIVRSILDAPNLSGLQRPNAQKDLQSILEYIQTHKENGIKDLPPNPFNGAEPSP
ncbi:MAG: hypothetical protein AAB733_01525 [Patescibacteria group bacterium]